MRPIKFRAWDKKQKEMFVFNIFDPIRELSLIEDNRREPYYHYEDWELMQFTGLKDSKGREIYEGDLMSTENNSVYPVMFEEGAFTCFMNDWDEYEVIGNIYENPEKVSSL